MYPAYPGTYFETIPSDIRGLLGNFVYECDKDVRVEIERALPMSAFNVWRGNCHLGTLFLSKTLWRIGRRPESMSGPAALRELINTIRADPDNLVAMITMNEGVIIAIDDEGITITTRVVAPMMASAIHLPFCRQVVEGLLDFLT